MAFRVQTTHVLLLGILLLTGIGMLSSGTGNLRGDASNSGAAGAVNANSTQTSIGADSSPLSSSPSLSPSPEQPNLNDGLNPSVPIVRFAEKLLCRPAGKMDTRGALALDSNDRSLSLRIDVEAMTVWRCLGETCEPFAVTRKDFAGNGMTFVNLRTNGIGFPRWSIAADGGYTELDLSRISFFGKCQALPTPS
ncbi:hypothetical protein HY285_03645 [Candidatus Peregrinibacteria bacterium]|nr:hypothetical protein [Candidatus Peregrinibacteria bacterium]MBI3816609.1 hypothetical protein [Candidatus Peregrinibacteria bacterium]